MIRRPRPVRNRWRLPVGRSPVPALLLASSVLAALVLAGLPGLLPVPGFEVLAAAQDEAGRGALRPYVHVLIAYGVAWVLILVWVWRIARGLKRAEHPRP